MVCDVAPGKNYQIWQGKGSEVTSFTKRCFQGGVLLDFFLVDQGLCKFHSKLWNHGPIFGGDVHLCKANNFCN
jgi:hypothetical protein